jgi:23S rRNA (cytosine1962-C5)-methyltransferase
LNAPELGVSFLHDQMKEFAPGLTFIQRLENPPEFADTSEDRSLKVLVYRSPTLVES